MSIKYSEQSRIFRDFRSIPYSDYYYLIRFYEQYNQDIDYLPLNEGLIMTYYYANALFETQEYDTLIDVANSILEQSIIHNIRYIDGEDVYMAILYKKTYAHLKLEEIETAQKLAVQLVRLDYHHFLHQALLRQCFLATRPTWIRPALTLSAITTLMGAFTTVVFTSFYWYLPSYVLVMPYSLLILALFGLMVTALGYYKYVMAPTRKIILQAKADWIAKEKDL